MPDVAKDLAAARDAVLARQFAEAADLARAVLADAPNCLAALRVLAWAQLSLGDEGAMETFGVCARLDPEDPLAEIGRGIGLERVGRTDEAVRAFVRAWELEPLDQQIRREVVRLGGDLPDSFLADGIQALHAGQPDAATGSLRQAAAADPQDAAALLALATALWRLGGKQQAYNLATTVLASNPQCVKAILYVLAVEAESGRQLRTRELIARAEQVDPGLDLFAEVVAETELQPVLDRYQVSRQIGTPGR